MNIDEYRAMKAKMEAEQDSDKEQPVKQEEEKTEPKTEPKTESKTEPKEEPKEEKKEEPKQEQPKEEKKEKPKLTDKIEIEGVGEVSLDELRKGYLRQSDYTKKTQELAKQRGEIQEALQFIDAVRSNPELAKKLSQEIKLPTLDPQVAKIMELESKLYDMMLEREIDILQHKYDDFDVREVLEFAHERKIINLEDAYLALKARKLTSKKSADIDIEELKKQIREELQKELEQEKNTDSIIDSKNSNKPVEESLPKITEAEKKVARRLFRDAKDPYAEYIKWRDVKKRR